MGFVCGKLAEVEGADPRYAKAAQLIQMTFGFSQNPRAPIRTEPAFLLGQHFLHLEKSSCALACHRLALFVSLIFSSFLFFFIFSIPPLSLP